MKKFIVIDGFDGSGKDTQAQFVYDLYKNDDKTSKVILRSNPEEDNFFGKTSHAALLKDGNIHKVIATIFFALDIFRSLILYYHKTDVLIFTRYLLASAYFPMKLVKPVYIIFGFILPKSSFMFYLDLPPEIAMERINARTLDTKQEIQTFENIKSLKKSRKKVNLISYDWIKIDGSKDKQLIKEEIANILLENIEN